MDLIEVTYNSYRTGFLPHVGMTFDLFFEVWLRTEISCHYCCRLTNHYGKLNNCILRVVVGFCFMVDEHCIVLVYYWPRTSSLFDLLPAGQAYAKYTWLLIVGGVTQHIYSLAFGALYFPHVTRNIYKNKILLKVYFIPTVRVNKNISKCF